MSVASNDLIAAKERSASATVPADRLLPGIHGLRGIAAVAVVLFHLGHVGHIAVPPMLGFIENDFAKGVYLFFVLSAFSLMYSTARRTGQPAWVTAFFVKRFWRIAPLFYLVLAIVLGWQLLGQRAIDPWQVVLNLTFLTAFVPQEGVVPAGWTVGVEMLFYALFPVVVLSIRSLRGAVVVAVASVAMTCAARVVLFREQGEWANFMLPSNLCFFAFGVLAYFLVQKQHSFSARMRMAAPVLALVLMFSLSLLEADSTFRKSPGLDTVVWGIAFGSLCVWQGVGSSQRGSWVLHYLGERSYSIYLLHPLVLRVLRDRIQEIHSAVLPFSEVLAYLACAGVVIGVLLVCCEASYRLIELPGIRMGARMNRHVVSIAQ